MCLAIILVVYVTSEGKSAGVQRHVLSQLRDCVCSIAAKRDGVLTETGHEGLLVTGVLVVF